MFSLGTRTVGGDAPCLVIAEAGVNHNGELALAHRLVDAAADARVDAIKFQTFDADALAAADAPKAGYQLRDGAAGESQREMLRRLQLSPEAHEALKRHAEARGLLFLSAPFEEQSAVFLVRLGVAALKVPSGELTNLPLLRVLARSGLPLLVSTGMSDLDEVGAAVGAVREAGATALALLHCTSSYPAPPESANLRAMATLRERFAVPVGYSDHTLGDAVPLAAVALGASLVEKHLTLDRALPGPDHAASMEPDALGLMVERIRAVERALGDGEKRPHACELETRRVARKSLFAARALAAGERLAADALVARRPGTGLSPARLESLVGRRLRRAVAADQMLVEDDLE
jgi:N-acetylneuraminate synthase/N,N'-diacetyllegionaminate synthase